MHSKSDNIEIMINDKADEDNEKHFDSLIKKYTIGFRTSMRGGDLFFVFDHLLYNKCHNINPNHGGSYADSPDWIKNKIF